MLKQWLAKASPLLLVLVVLCCYFGIIDAPFKTLDDNFSIVKNELIRDWKNVGEIFTSSFFGGGAYYRPLVMFSFLLEYQWVGLESWLYNLTNVMLHVINTLLVWLLLGRIYPSRGLAFGGALIFAVHPVQWEAVTNIPGRSILLSSCFSLAAMVVFLEYLKSKSRIVLLWVAALCLMLGLLSKESSVMTAPVLSVLVWLRLSEKNWIKRAWKTIAKVWPFWLVVAGYLIWRNHLDFNNFYTSQTVSDHILAVITFAKAQVIYWRMFFWPYDAHFDRSLELFSYWSDPEVWLVLGLYGLLAVQLWRYRRCVSKTLWLLLGWWVLEWFPVSQVIASVGVQPGYIMISDHFYYMPMVAAAMLAMLLYDHLSRRWAGQVLPLRLCHVVVGWFLTGWVVMTLFLVSHARSEISMFVRTLMFAPHNTRIRTSYGLALAVQGEFEVARQQFERVLAIEPTNEMTRISLGKAQCDLGDCLKALETYRQVRNPGRLEGLLKENIDQTLSSVEAKYLKRIQDEPNNADWPFSLGVLLFQHNKWTQAADMFDQALKIKPTHRGSLYNRAALAVEDQDWQMAYKMIQRFEQCCRQEDPLTQNVDLLKKILPERLLR